jgi:hypothetical protein
MLNIVEQHAAGLLKYLLLKAIRGNMEDVKFNKRAFYSTVMLVSGILLPVSGILNHQTGFDGLTPERHFWMSVHNVAAILFTIFGILHVKLNWKPMKNYLNKARTVMLSKEALYGIALVVILVGLFSLHAFAVRPVHP